MKEAHYSLNTHVSGKTKDAKEEQEQEQELSINEELYKDIPALEETTPKQRGNIVNKEKSKIPASQQYISSAEDSDGGEEMVPTDNDDPDYTPETLEKTLLKENSSGLATPLNYVWKAANFFGRGSNAREPLQENNNVETAILH